MNQRNFSFIVKAASLAFLLACTCANADFAGKADVSSRLKTAEARWNHSKIKSYSFIIERSCMLCEPPARVVIKNNKCVSAVAVADPKRTLSCAGLTVQEMFQEIHRRVDNPTTSVLEVTFDNKLGYLSSRFMKTNIPHETERDQIKEFRKLD